MRDGRRQLGIIPGFYFQSIERIQTRSLTELCESGFKIPLSAGALRMSPQEGFFEYSNGGDQQGYGFGGASYVREQTRKIVGCESHVWIFITENLFLNG